MPAANPPRSSGLALTSSPGAEGGDRRDRDRNVRGVNSALAAASNRASREREAEQDRELIERARNGDQQAFRTLVERHQRRAFAIALGFVRDEQDAREVVQEAFLRVHRGIDSFHGGSSFFTWLYRIVTNLSIDLMRRPGRREAELDERRHHGEETDIPFLARIDGADPVDVVRRRELAERIRQALEALPPYHRGVILMREVEGMSYEEMAQAMDVSKGTIMSRLFHARQKLQRALADCYAEEGGASTPSRGEGP
ncbi:MAG: sigma-70 family RNA polymerase sigma factor [Polyangiaceae bacterium]|nr:sigma-70 family RNA polymerase sigma factor [Polyangiaceae bacterium]